MSKEASNQPANISHAERMKQHQTPRVSGKILRRSWEIPQTLAVHTPAKSWIKVKRAR
jgi:hypothetical protein